MTKLYSPTLNPLIKIHLKLNYFVDLYYLFLKIYFVFTKK